jgi:hypothetical protein
MRTVPGAAPTALRDLLTGPVTRGRVLGVHRTAVYVEAAGQVVAVETADGLRLPCAVRLGIDRTDGPFGRVRRGSPARVGDGVVVAEPLTVRAVRWWAPRRPRAGVRADRADRLAQLLGDSPAPVPAAAPVAELLGRGPGLTPAGDDVLTGLLVALWHHPVLRDPVAAEVTRDAPVRTTALSATLLRAAAAGHALPAVLDVADALAGHGPDDMAAVVDRLVAVGHSSGVALAHGLLRGARTVAGNPDQEAA